MKTSRSTARCVDTPEIGGSRLIGTKLVNNLRQHRQEVVAASPSSGVNTITDEGLNCLTRAASFRSPETWPTAALAARKNS